MSNDVVKEVAKGYAPIAASGIGGVGFALEWLDVINKILATPMIILGILGAFWYYHEKKASALKAEAERIEIRLKNDRLKIENDERMIAAEVQKGALQFIAILTVAMQNEKLKKNTDNQHNNHGADWLHD